ncbi:MAG: cyclic nucleotide-binding and patatin-like phospholipase domain-containing protein [Pseudomonadota bacterium]
MNKIVAKAADRPAPSKAPLGVAEGPGALLSVQALCASVDALSNLSEEALGALSRRMSVARLKRGDVLIREGDTANRLFIVATGRFHVVVGPQRRVTAEIGPAEPVGEVAFLAGGTRTADVVAARDSTVVTLSRADYESLVKDVPAIADALLKSLANRLAAVAASAPRLQPRAMGTIALCPAGGAPIPPALADAITTALEAASPITVITRASVPDGIDLRDEAKLADWLLTLETANRRTVLLLTGDDPVWDRTALRQCDNLVLIAPLSATPEVSDLERYAFDVVLPNNRTLILWREDGAREITGTGAWLEDREVHLHHHVTLNDEGSVARAGRFLSGTAVGAVFAGGGALGCAHMGVMTALMEAGATLDMFGGTSVGAAMATGLASGLSPRDVLAISQEIFVERRAMKRLTVPLHSVLDHRVFDKELERHYGTTALEDLPFNAFAVSTSLSTNRAHVHLKGPAWEAVRASAAIPAILPPFITPSGEVLVDGALVDNQPVAIMRSLKSGPNVVVGFSDGREWRVATPYAALPTRAQIARNLALGQRPSESFPKIAETLMRSMMVASRRVVEDTDVQNDLVIVPPVAKGIGLLDWPRGHELADAAYAHTVALLEDAGGIDALLAAPPRPRTTDGGDC